MAYKDRLPLLQAYMVALLKDIRIMDDVKIDENGDILESIKADIQRYHIENGKELETK